MTTKKNEAVAIEIKPIDVKTVNVRIQGTAPLIVHKWSEKAKREMLEKQMGTTKYKSKHEPKNPVADFIGSAYWLTAEPTEGTEEAFRKAVDEGARWGFPVTAIKQAAIMAASRNEIDIKTTTLRGAFFIKGEGSDMLAEIKGSIPHIREDMVRVGGISKTADIRHRAQFDDWYMDLEIQYNQNGPVSLEQIINLINLGGFTNGIGEWRPERDGSYGTFEVSATAMPNNQ